jgi:hypothetical protein
MDLVDVWVRVRFGNRLGALHVIGVGFLGDMSGRDGTQHLDCFVGSQTEQLRSGQLFSKGMWGYFSDGPVGVGDQLTGGGTVGGKEEHGDVEAGRAGQQRRPSPHGIVRHVGEDGEKKRKWVLGDRHAVAGGVRCVRGGESTSPGDHLRLDGPQHVVGALCSPNSAIRIEVGQKSLGEVGSEKDFGGAGAGPR